MRHSRTVLVSPEGRRSPAAVDSWRGFMWSGFAAVAFFLLSNPREILTFPQSLNILLCLTVFVVLADARRVWFPTAPWLVWAFLALCALSALWSGRPGETLRATLLYAIIALIAGLTAANVETPVLVRGVVWGAFLVGAATLLAALVGYSRAGGPIGVAPLHGIHGNRNVVSYSLVLGLAALLASVPTGSGRPSRREYWRYVRWFAALAVLCSTIFLVRSGTGIAASAALLVAAALLALERRYLLLTTVAARVVGIVMLVVGVAIASRFGQEILALLGKGADLSGRVPQWRAIVDVWGEMPWGGYGWGAVWSYSWFDVEPSAPKLQIDQQTGYWLSHGHNILFDLLPQLGIAGVLGMCLILGSTAAWVFIRVGDLFVQGALWAGLGSMALILNGITEPMLSVPVGWLVLVMISCTGQRLRRDGALDGIVR